MNDYVDACMYKILLVACMVILSIFKEHLDQNTLTLCDHIIYVVTWLNIILLIIISSQLYACYKIYKN